MIYDIAYAKRSIQTLVTSTVIACDMYNSRLNYYNIHVVSGMTEAFMYMLGSVEEELTADYIRNICSFLNVSSIEALEDKVMSDILQLLRIGTDTAGTAIDMYLYFCGRDNCIGQLGPAVGSILTNKILLQNNIGVFYIPSKFQGMYISASHGSREEFIDFLVKECLHI